MMSWWRLLSRPSLAALVALGLVACSGREVEPTGDRRPSLTVAWQPVLGEAGPYRVYYGISATHFDGFHEASSPPFTFTRLAAGMRYFFSVRIVGPEGEIRWESETYAGTPLRGSQERLDVGKLAPPRNSGAPERPQRTRKKSPVDRKASIPESSRPPVEKSDDGTVKLEWDAPTQREDGTPLDNLLGYRLYYGTEKANLTSKVWTTETRATVKNLRRGTTYYFYVRAVDRSRIESEPSEILSTTVK
jgi:hypothetical protein